MAIFPALVPSARTFTPGEYPNTPYKAWSGSEERVRHSNVMLESTLRLSFNGITEAQMLSILTHYQGQRGGFESFDLPSEAWSGVTTISDYELTNYRWCYSEPPTVNDLPCGNHIVELSLVTVPPEGTSLIGLESLIILSITGGSVAVSNGLTKTIAWSLAPGAGDAPINAAGLSSEVNLEIDGGNVEITPAGLSSTISLSLEFTSISVSADGLEKTVTASIAGGAASNSSGDPDFADVGLLLHMDGTNGSTTFTDSSSNNHTITVYGDAQISTAQSKFGGASGLFDADGDYLRPPASATLAPGTGDFTLECWLRFNSISGSQAMIAYGSTSLVILKDATHKFRGYISGSSTISTTTAVVDTWYHVAWCRSGTTCRLFINGTEEGTALTSSANLTLNQPYIGRVSTGSSQMNGYIDDLRITKAARYTSNFTPPTEAFPDS